MLAGALAACDAGHPSEQPIDLPPLHVVDVLAATSTTPDGELVYEPLARDGTTQVLSTTPFKIRFDRLLLPGTATRQAVCLQPLIKKVIGPGDCTAGVFLEPSYDPVRREVTYRQSPESPPLAPDIAYALTAYVAISPTDLGFRSFDGTSLPELVRFDLGVQNDGGTPVPFDLGPTGDHYCAGPTPGCTGDDCARSVSALLGACGGCHGGPQPAMGLDLSSSDGLATTALGVAAHGTQTGEHASDPDESPTRFGRAMPLIDPRVPGNSYLVYKLLANRRTPLEVPFPGPDGEEPAEVRRIRNTIVVGMPMPPSTALHASLRSGEAEWIADWILQGAPTAPSCP